MSSRMIRSASGRTARRTNRSSSSSRSRTIPGLITLRPADANEVVEAWRVIIGLKHQPACLVLSRQPLPTFDRTRYASAAGVARGAYVMADAESGKPAVILIGTGSEVALCVEAYEALKQEGIAARVVSMPSWELFEQQDQAYRDNVLPPEIKARVSVEAGSVIGWDRYVGMQRRQDRHAHFRLVGPDQRSADEIRLHAGEGTCRGQGADREIPGGRRHESAEAARSMRPVALAGLS